MSRDSTVERLVARYVERHVLHGERLDLPQLCRDHPQLLEEVRRHVGRYESIDDTLSNGQERRPRQDDQPPRAQDLPSFDGFHTIERLGRGGMGEVYKVRDLKLDRTVAAKVLRADSPLTDRYGSFLREARSLALFRDPRVVQIHEFRTTGDAPVIFMEYVEGFDLARVAPSLEFRQRAAILAEVCEAIENAHRLGIQHRDLKPANILLDDKLSPKIVDFGLSQGDPGSGHLVGTLPYLAPEQLDPERTIDARTDVYALGVILYQILCDARPYEGETQQTLLAAIRQATPRLPAEIDPEVPEPLQAIALKAMEHDPAQRYMSAGEMARDLRRFLEDRPVVARPTLYRSALGRRIRPHLQQIDEWLNLRLIYPHEARKLTAAYDRLETREDDWIMQSRVLSRSQIALYFGAFVLLCGALLYFGAHRLHGAGQGLAGPLLVLGLPFVALNVCGVWLYRRGYQAVATAFYLAGVAVLPLFLLLVFHETGMWPADPGDSRQFFEGGDVSNRQLQLSLTLSLAWAGWMAWRTRTVGLSSVATLLLGLSTLAFWTDFGLGRWLEEHEWDRLGLSLLPLLAIEVVLASWADRRGRPWLARPIYVSCALLLVAMLELLSLDGRALHAFGITLAQFQPAQVSNPSLLDTLVGMTLAGVMFYGIGVTLERRGTTAMSTAVWLLIAISPFAVLEPLMFLVNSGEYSPRLDWVYLAFAVAIVWLSHHHQRKMFYLAGLLNTGVAISIITYNRGWFDRVGWGALVVLVGLSTLLVGLGLAFRERNRRRFP